jgi:chemotaxis protein methyltransferase CheR
VKQNLHHGKLRMWSAGCSTGEEPYSLAILLREYFPEVSDWDIQVLGTDINKRALRQAREGLYGERSLRMMEPALRERYFRKVGNNFLIDEQIRRMVHFDYLNLQSDLFPAEGNAARDIDLLSCRNVLIYFELGTSSWGTPRRCRMSPADFNATTRTMRFFTSSRSFLPHSVKRLLAL